jgi:hypothetical protein
LAFLSKRHEFTARIGYLKAFANQLYIPGVMPSMARDFCRFSRENLKWECLYEISLMHVLILENKKDGVLTDQQ